MHYKKYKTILSPKNGMNLYRGCTHGCIYCDSRSACYKMDHNFEDIEVKESAPEILRREMARKRKKCMIGTGAMCDPYMPIENELCLTRRCLESIYEYGFGVAIQTKSAGILRDIDLLAAIHKRTKCVVQMTLTTSNEDICKLVEPNVSTTRERFEALMAFRERGVPTVVWLTPILPFINDTLDNARGLMDYCVRVGTRGVLYFGAGMTLREGNREYFYSCLDKSFPGVKNKYVKRFGEAYACFSEKSAAISDCIIREAIRHGILFDQKDVFAYLHSFDHDNSINNPKQLSF